MNPSSFRLSVLLFRTEVLHETYKENYFLTASKETAFVYALTSAAVVHAVTKSCTAGDLPDCVCKKSRLKRRIKPRCNENIQYGLLFSELFVDAPDHERRASIAFRRSGQHLVNLHNSKAGRQVIFILKLYKNLYYPNETLYWWLCYCLNQILSYLHLVLIFVPIQFIC